MARLGDIFMLNASISISSLYAHLAIIHLECGVHCNCECLLRVVYTQWSNIYRAIASNIRRHVDLQVDLDLDHNPISYKNFVVVRESNGKVPVQRKEQYRHK